MPQPSAEQNSWIKSVLGLDVLAMTAGSIQGKELDDDEQKHSIFTAMARKAMEIKVELSAPPTDKDLAAALKTLDEKIDVAEKLGLDAKRMKVDRNDCATAASNAEKLTGDDKAPAMKKANKRIEDLTNHVNALIDSAKSVMGTSKDPPTAKQKSAIYQKAIEDHYGIKIENPDKMDNTHLDRVFDMFGTLPLADTDHDKLATLQYDKSSAGGGSYNRVSCVIKMGEFGDAAREENYEIEGEVLPVNSFDVTTLHEVGHSVDNKHGFMSSNGSKTGCGGWKSETSDTAAAAYLKDLKTSLTLSDKAKDPDLLAAVKTALSSGGTAKPDAIEQADWDEVIKYLTEKVLKSRADNKPWFRGAPVIGGRVYQESYSNNWWSYDDGAKSATKVNGYQWRAPGEWFAEVYAITWMKKKKPPSGVDAAAAAFMWNG